MSMQQSLPQSPISFGPCIDTEPMHAQPTEADGNDVVAAFIAALPLAQVEPVDGEHTDFSVTSDAVPVVLRLPVAIPWLDPQGHGMTSLLVRPVFWHALARMTERPAPPTATVVTGAAGVGKTAFLVWLLEHLRRRKPAPPSIVLHTRDQYCLVRSDGHVLHGQPDSDFRKELRDPSTWLLCDASDGNERSCLQAYGSKSKDVCGNRVICVSACVLHHVEVTDAVVLPLWSLEELEVCRQACYPFVSTRDLTALYHLWGGVPRWTIARSSHEAKFQFMDALASLSFTKLVNFVQGNGECQHPVLLHVDVQPSIGASGALQPFVWKIASPFAARALLCSSERKRQATQIQLSAVTRCKPPFLALVNQLTDTYEAVPHPSS